MEGALQRAIAEDGWKPMSEWDQRNDAVLLMVDYGEDGEHAIDDAMVALTIGHNNDHNVGEGEGEGWQFAGWCWCQDHYTQGKGTPIAWLPIDHQLARAVEAERYPMGSIAS